MDNPFVKKESPGEEKKQPGFGSSLFGKHTEAPSIAVSELSNQLNNFSRRLRITEERYTNLRNNTQLTDQNILKLNKDFQRETAAINSDIAEMKREFIDLRDKVRLIVKELVGCAKTEEIKILEKYLNLWDPVKFVQRTEVEKIVEERISLLLDNKSKDLKE